MCKGAVAPSGAAPLLTEVSAHAGLVLAVGLWLRGATETRNRKVQSTDASIAPVVVSKVKAVNNKLRTMNTRLMSLQLFPHLFIRSHIVSLDAKFTSEG